MEDDFSFMDDMTPEDRRAYLDNLRDQYQERKELNDLVAQFQEKNELDKVPASGVFSRLFRQFN